MGWRLVIAAGAALLAGPTVSATGAGGPENPDAPTRAGAALAKTLAGYGPDVAFSRVFVSGVGTVAGVVYGSSRSGFGAAKLDVLAYQDGSWRKRAGLTLSPNGFAAGAMGYREADNCDQVCILSEHLTAPDETDVVVELPLGVNNWLYVARVDAGSAQLVPFETGATKMYGIAVTADPGNAIEGNTVVSSVSGCNPNCASGKLVKTVWRYDAGTRAFVHLAPSPGRVIPVPLNVPVTKSFTRVVSWFTYPASAHAPAADFTATVAWGDRTSSAGTITADAKLDPVDAAIFAAEGRTAFAITATHAYGSLDSTRFTVTVDRHGETSSTATGAVTIVAVNPVALFFFDPGNPTENDLTLLLPTVPSPLQRPIAAYDWSFDDGTPQVKDDPAMRPLYSSVIAKLLADPGDGDARAKAEKLGILPPGQGGGPLGVLGLSSDQVKQIAGVWNTYFPEHVTPHIYAKAGPVHVTLTVTDSAGATSTVTRSVTVGSQCKTWVVPFNPGYTTCDTVAGFKAFADGPKRGPDYWTIDLSDSFGSLAALKLPRIGLSGGVSLSLAHDRTVYLTVHAEVGASASAGLGGPTFTVTKGWEGPWDATQTPPNSEIDGFIKGVTYPITAFLQLTPDWRFGVALVLSPGPPARGGEEEPAFGAEFRVSVGLSAGKSCSIQILKLPTGWQDAERRLLKGLDSPSATLAALNPAVYAAVQLLQPQLIPAIQEAFACLAP